VAGAVIAAACTVPDLWWQAQHRWATIAMTQALNRENGGLGNIGTWVAGQLVIVTLALVWVWLAGLVFLWRSRRPLWRALVWAYALLFVFFALTTGAKIYYLAGAYPALLAAGVVALDGWLAARPGRLRGLLLATAVTTAAALPLVLPVLPAADIGWTYPVNQENGESLGWPSWSRPCTGPGYPCRPPSAPTPSSSPPTTAKPARSATSAGRSACPPPSAARTANGGGDQAAPAPPPSSRSQTGPAAAPPWPGSSPASHRWPPCRTRRESTTRNGAARSTCAPGPRSPGPGYGRCCATTTDPLISAPARIPRKHLRGETIATPE
jgi:hypothetical protein